MAKGNDRSEKMRQKTKQRAAEAESTGFYPYLIIPEGTKVNYFNPKKGTYEIDVIPYEVSKPKGNPDGLEKGDLFHRRLIYVHENVGASNKKYLCLKTWGEKCPICEARAALYAEGTAESKALAGKLKSKTRELRNVINITDATEEKKGIQLWNSSYPLVGDLLEKEIRDSTRKDRSGFALLEGGATLTIRFDEKSIDNGKPFPFADRIDFENRDDYDEDILEQCFDLDEILDKKSYEELEKIFLEVEEETEDDDPPKRSRKSKEKEEEPEEEKSKRSRKSKEEEPEEKPSRRSKKDVEDDPEPPKRSRRGKEEKEETKEEFEPEEGSYVTVTDEDEDEFTGTVTTLTSKKITIEDKDGEEHTFKLADVKIEEAETPKKKKKKEEGEETPKRSRKTKEEEPEEKPKRKSKGSDNECPVKGGTFGEDCDEFDECFDCDLWKACKAESKKK